MAQDPSAERVFADAKRALDVPFSDDELFIAYRVTMSAAEARDFVRALRADQAEGERRIRWLLEDPEGFRRAHSFGPDESPAFGIGLSDDTLIILSLLNEALARRVAEYRRRFFGDDPDEDRLNARRAEIKPWVEARFAEIRRGGR